MEWGSGTSGAMAAPPPPTLPVLVLRLVTATTEIAARIDEHRPPLGLTCQLPTQPAHNHCQAIARGAGVAGVIDHREPDRRTGIAIVPLAVGRRSTVIFTADKRRRAPQIVRSATVKRTASHMDGRGQARIAGIGEGGNRTAGMTARANL